MKTFEEIFKDRLTNEEVRNLKDISNGKDWLFLRDAVERHIMEWTYNLLTQDNKDESDVDQLKALRGFVNGWKTIKRLIEEKNG